MGAIEIIKPLFTVQCSAVNKSRQHQETILGNAKNRTWGCWVRSKHATFVICRSPMKLKAYSCCFGQQLGPMKSPNIAIMMMAAVVAAVGGVVATNTRDPSSNPTIIKMSYC